jgi:phage-related protein
VAEHEKRTEAPIAWEGDSREVIRGFPEDIRPELGIDLQLLQWGNEPKSYKPMPSVGKGVFELRQQDKRSWYRVIYLSRIEGVIYVLHCFEKKSAKTPRKDISLARSRYGVFRQRLAARKKEAKKRSK